MKRFLPSRLEISENIGKEYIPPINKKSELERVFELLKEIKNTNPELQELIIEAKEGVSNSLPDKRLIDDFFHKLEEVFQEEDSNATNLIQEDSRESLKPRNIEVSVIVPQHLKTRLYEINRAIKTLASFVSHLVPKASDEILFNYANAGDDKPDFWIQDKFLVLEKDNKGNVRPIDDSLGKIEHIAFTYYSDPDSKTVNSYNKIYVDLILKIARVFENISHSQKNAEPKNQRSITFLENKEKSGFLDQVDGFVNSLGLNNRRKVNIQPSTLLFKGGNILFIGGFALIGYDTVIESFFDDTESITDKYGKMHEDKRMHKDFMSLMKDKEDLFKATFSNETGVDENKIIFIGSKEIIAQSMHPKISILRETSNDTEYRWLRKWTCFAQWIYHIDLFITAAGKDETKMADTNCVFVGTPVNTADHYFPIYEVTKKFTDDVAKKLEDNGLKVYRNPLPLTYIDSSVEGGNSIRKWFFASYNNCIVQYTSNPKDRYVWMPVYGSSFSNEYVQVNGTEKACGDWTYLKEYDDKNREMWESIGFKVERLTNYLPFAVLRGATRCLSKVLLRSSY